MSCDLKTYSEIWQNLHRKEVGLVYIKEKDRRKEFTTQLAEIIRGNI